jgi:Ferritin-like domain
VPAMASPTITDRRGDDRRGFLRKSLLAGATAGSAGLLLGGAPALAKRGGDAKLADPTAGDIAILKFLSAAEQLEDDLWQQYDELARGNRGYNAALRRIDRSLVRYIGDDRDDERSHAALINGYLKAIGEQPVDLSPFRTLPSVKAPGADQRRRRLTNLTNLTVDTSWYLRYRGTGNPDFGDTFPQLVDIVNRPTVPTSPRLRYRAEDMQVLAHSAAFHFAAIEQGGGSLYTALLSKVTHPDVVAILASIGPTEVYHFSAFHKSLEGLFGLRANGLRFPDLKNSRNLSEAIFPEPCTFLRPDLPLCSVIRPRNIENAGAVAAATGLVNSGLFEGQSKAFFDAVVALAKAADAAQRGF